ncbi:PTS sugar transporter subunit IIC [Clostridium carnis]
MNKLTTWMEEHFVPVAAKFGSQRHLCAIRDAFIAIMPITMAGSIAVLLNVFFRDLPTTWGMTDFVASMSPVITINGIVYWGTISIIALAFVFALGYNLSKSYDINPIAGGIIAFASLIMTTPQIDSAESWGYLNISGYGGATGLFTAVFIGLISTMIYVFITKHNIVIKLPDSVPPAVNKAFAAIIPGLIAMYSVAIITYLVQNFTGSSINELMLKYIQMPLLGLSQGLGSVILITFLVQLFWFFGLHGHNVLAPIMDGVYMTALNENISVFQNTNDISQLPWLWTRGSFDAYAQMGGSGVTIALIIAIFIASKREDQRQIAKLGAPMGIFNINEPITFGIPIVLNPIYAIPWLIIPPICVTIGYLFTSLGVIPPVFVSVPWIMPPGVYAFLATGGSLLAGAVSLLNVAVAFFIWLPFVKLANKTDYVE